MPSGASSMERLRVIIFTSALARAIGREVREGEFLVHGADVDDLARRFAGLEVLDESLRREEWAFQIRMEHEIVVRLSHVPERGVLFHPGVVDQDVDLAEGRDAVADQFIDVGHCSEVGPEGHRVLGLAPRSSPSRRRLPPDANDNSPTISAPSSARRTAMAAPIPWLLPVTSATFPESFMTGLLLEFEEVPVTDTRTLAAASKVFSG